MGCGGWEGGGASAVGKIERRFVQREETRRCGRGGRECPMGARSCWSETGVLMPHPINAKGGERRKEGRSELREGREGKAGKQVGGLGGR